MDLPSALACAWRWRAMSGWLLHLHQWGSRLLGLGCTLAWERHTSCLV